GYKSCMYRTYCVGKKPTKEQNDFYHIAYDWLYRAIEKVKPGATTKEIAEVWPSAMETWGYKEEDQAAANLWGHGLGLAQYDTPVISRIYSLDFPVEIRPGHELRPGDPARQAAAVGGEAGRDDGGDGKRAGGHDPVPDRRDHGHRLAGR
ncbi:MAG: aminopeptidase P family protein, partial [Deltaproteobacteria bacterium]|nr:aminopeptidase P family protein [Deltaproteobacteria bacterium]